MVTKVEYPEELDTRFSKFSEPDSEDLYDDILDSASDNALNGADDILGMFKKMQEERQKAAEKQEENSFTPLNGKKETEKESPVNVLVDITKLFVFQDLDELTRLAQILKGFYSGKNDLYKSAASHKYYLLISKSKQSPEEFNKVCNILSEYAVQENYTPATGAFFKEHYDVILKDNALQTLAEL